MNAQQKRLFLEEIAREIGTCWCTSPDKARERGQRIAKGFQHAYNLGLKAGREAATTGDKAARMKLQRFNEVALAHLIAKYLVGAETNTRDDT